MLSLVEERLTQPSARATLEEGFKPQSEMQLLVRKLEDQKRQV
jgi:hypothetical protein